MKTFISFLVLLVDVMVSGGESCDGGKEAELFCPMDCYLMRGIGSRSPFFTSALASTCTNMNDEVFNDDEEMLSKSSADGVLDVECPGDKVIHKMKMCIKDGKVGMMTLHCRSLQDTIQLGDRFDATSADMQNLIVDCGDSGAVKGVRLSDAKDGIYQTDFDCVRVERVN